MQASVTFRTDDGQLHELGHGDLIGRVWSAALCLDDARVSEAHAMVSLRGSKLRLLALRGLFAVDGKPLKELDLTEGQLIQLATGVELAVVDVHLPSTVLALEAPGLGRRLLAGVCSLIASSGQVRLRPGAREEALAVFYVASGGWRVRTEQGVTPLAEGWSIRVPGGAARVVAQALDERANATRAAARVMAPMVLTTRYDTVLIQREGHPTLRVTGRSARMISELAQVGTALHWEPLARSLWPDAPDPLFLRRRFDAMLWRLRRKLEEAGVRTDLVRSDHSGLFELVLASADELIDESG